MADEIINNAAEAADLDPGMIARFLRELPDRTYNLSIKVVFAVLTLIIGWQIIKGLRKLTNRALVTANLDKGLVQFIDSLLTTSLRILLIMLIATRFGLETTTLVAMLGSVGVAFALALQGSLSNCAGGVLILLHKLYVVGDYIADASGNEGTVKYINLFYTALITGDGKIITLPNGALANGRLTNFTATSTRRIELLVGISYEGDIIRARDIIMDIINKDERVLKDLENRVFVANLNSSSVDLGVWAWVNNPDYLYAKGDLQEKIKYALDENKIPIPYPQLDVHIN